MTTTLADLRHQLDGAVASLDVAALPELLRLLAAVFARARIRLDHRGALR